MYLLHYNSLINQIKNKETGATAWAFLKVLVTLSGTTEVATKIGELIKALFK